MILIVDDDPSVLASLRLVLKQAGWPSHGLASPAEAIAWLETSACELVIQDMNFSRQTSSDVSATPAPPSSSPARVARARSWWRRRCTATAGGARGRS